MPNTHSPSSRQQGQVINTSNPSMISSSSSSSSNLSSSSSSSAINNNSNNQAFNILAPIAGRHSRYSNHNDTLLPLPPISEKRRASSASPPPHLPSLILQRPGNNQSTDLPPIAPIRSLELGPFGSGSSNNNNFNSHSNGVSSGLNGNYPRHSFAHSSRDSTDSSSQNGYSPRSETRKVYGSNDRQFPSHLTHFDFSQRRHSIANGNLPRHGQLSTQGGEYNAQHSISSHPVSHSHNGSPFTFAPPSPVGWSQKRKMSYDRSIADSSIPFGSQSPYSFDSHHGHHQDLTEGGPSKRRGSTFDTKMNILSLTDRPDQQSAFEQSRSFLPPPSTIGPGGYRRDSIASQWSLASQTEASGGTEGDSPGRHTGYQNGAGGPNANTEGGKGHQPHTAFAWTGFPPGPVPTYANHSHGSQMGSHLYIPPTGSHPLYSAATIPSNHPARSVPADKLSRPDSPLDSAGLLGKEESPSASSRMSISPRRRHRSTPTPPMVRDGRTPTPLSSSSAVPKSPIPPGHPSFSSAKAFRSRQSSRPSVKETDSDQTPSSSLAPPDGNRGSGNEGDAPYSRSPELRVSHKLAERKRRKEMKELMEELRDQLPADKSAKSSKWEILSKAVEYISLLEHTNADKDQEIQALRRELDSYRPTH